MKTRIITLALFMGPKLRLHRNSQKRYYIDDAIYFITTNTYNGYPYLKIDILCELFAYEIETYKQINEFKIHGYKINPEHIHLLIEPYGKCNYSQIIRSLKSNFARNANRVLGYEKLFITSKAGSRDPAFVEHVRLLQKSCDQFIKQFGVNHNIPKFKWQSSFYDHIIRDDFDYLQHLKYIQNQWIKHKLPSNKWCWVIGENKEGNLNEYI